MTPRPAIRPANEIRPARAARTGWPGRPSRSTPRCPGPNRVLGGSNRATTSGRGSSGQTPWPGSTRGPAAAADAATADAATGDTVTGDKVTGDAVRGGGTAAGVGASATGSEEASEAASEGSGR